MAPAPKPRFPPTVVQSAGFPQSLVDSPFPKAHSAPSDPPATSAVPPIVAAPPQPPPGTPWKSSPEPSHQALAPQPAGTSAAAPPTASPVAADRKYKSTIYLPKAWDDIIENEIHRRRMTTDQRYFGRTDLFLEIVKLWLDSRPPSE